MADAATVMTGESSLRNYAYEPSKQGSAEESPVPSDDDDDGASALSSIRSSVKRGLRQQKSKGISGTQSVSTKQSDGSMWQDDETEVELYDTDEEEELQQQQKTLCDRDRYQSASHSEEKEFHLDVISENAQAEDEQGTGLSHTSSEEGRQSRAVSEDCKRHGSTEENVQMGKNRREKGNNRSSVNRSSNRSEPTKRLRFSKESLHEVVNSRDDKRNSRRKKAFPVLEHVEYYPAYDDASTNQDVSTIHPFGMEECDEIFKERIPFEVPVTQPSTDDMSSIHALSTKLPIEKLVQQVESKLEETINKEEGSVAITIPGVHTEVDLDRVNDEILTEEQPTWVQLMLVDRSNSEIFLITLVGVSFITLVVLIMILIAL